MTNEETSVIEQANSAHALLEELILAKYNIAANYLVIGGILSKIRRDGLFKMLGCDSFNEFLGMPEVKLKHSKANYLAHIYELYKVKLGVDDSRLLKIGIANLNLIAPVVESDKEEWLSKAESLSSSDLRIELGVGPGENVSPPCPPALPCPNGCAICGESPTEKSHFPITRGAGARDEDWVPMCRGCHEEFHRGPEKFILNYKRNWSRWFYDHMNRGE